MNVTRDKKHPVVILCGFMGTGKTEAGRRLARSLGVPFIDTDEIIEENAGKSVSDIFATVGKKRFREYEREACMSLDPGRAGAVIATGGGMVVDDDNFSRLESLGTMVLLEASIESIANRTSQSDVRPLLSAGADALHHVESMLAERDAVYNRIPRRLDTTNRSPEETAFDLEEMLRYGEALTSLRVDTRPIPGQAPGPDNTHLSRLVTARGVSDELGTWLERLHLDTRVFLLIPAAIDKLYGARLRAALDGIPHESITVQDGDDNKNTAQVERLLDSLAQAGAGRDSVIVAVGGGVTGDVAGFVASIYMRGLPLVHVPTTLLAQVDASIGGKTGVNTARAKNLVGAMYQPHLVLCDPDFLQTLPERQVANGMAEVVKTAMLGSASLYELLETRAKDNPLTDPASLEACIRECVAIKGRIVERDPYERDLRRILNLGHTAGHALEKAQSYTGLLHGEAISLGLLAALRVGITRGVTDPTYLDRTRRILAACRLPLDLPDVDIEAVRAALALDKKRRAGKLTFVLPIRPGHVEIVDDVDEDELIAQLRAKTRE